MQLKRARFKVLPPNTPSPRWGAENQHYSSSVPVGSSQPAAGCPMQRACPGGVWLWQEVPSPLLTLGFSSWVFFLSYNRALMGAFGSEKRFGVNKTGCEVAPHTRDLFCPPVTNAGCCPCQIIQLISNIPSCRTSPDCLWASSSVNTGSVSLSKSLSSCASIKNVPPSSIATSLGCHAGSLQTIPFIWGSPRSSRCAYLHYWGKHPASAMLGVSQSFLLCAAASLEAMEKFTCFPNTLLLEELLQLTDQSPAFSFHIFPAASLQALARVILMRAQVHLCAPVTLYKKLPFQFWRPGERKGLNHLPPIMAPPVHCRHPSALCWCYGVDKAKCIWYSCVKQRHLQGSYKPEDKVGFLCWRDCATTQLLFLWNDVFPRRGTRACLLFLPSYGTAMRRTPSP